LPSETPWLRLSDIADNIQSILTYTKGMNFSEFAANQLVCDATERCVARISEAAIKLGPFAESTLPGHDWQAIRGIGNVLRHDYDRVSMPQIWDVVTFNLSPLLNDVQSALGAHQSEGKS